MTLGVLFMMLGCAYLNVWFIANTRNMQNAMHKKESVKFYYSLRFGCLMAVCQFPVIGLREGLKGSLALEWRRFLSHRFIVGYIGNNQAYYRLKVETNDIDNPDQRIGQDVGQFTEHSVNFVHSILHAIIVIGTQSGMLLSIDR